MSNTTLITDLYPVGSALFADSETFLKDLSEDDESMVTGGKRSNSNSGRRKRNRRPRRRRASGKRSVSRT